MSWYQLISLALVLYFSWNLMPAAYALFNGQSFTISWFFRAFFTLLFGNLAVAFLGAPW